MVKRAAVIHDLSGLGKCSLTAAIPVLSVMGVQACPVPTAILTNQTGFDSYYCDDYTDKIDYFTEEWKKLDISFRGIYTGYLGSSAQVKKILAFCDVFKRDDTLLVVDPVMGDMGKVYDVFTPEFGTEMKHLVTHADVITPNLTECCLLTGTDYNELTSHANQDGYLERIEAMARPLLLHGIQSIIITGIIHKEAADRTERYYNMVIEEDGFEVISSPILGESYSGTGDLLASVVCAGMMQGKKSADCVRLAVDFLNAALQDTANEKVPRNEGLNFEPYLSLLFPDK